MIIRDSKQRLRRRNISVSDPNLITFGDNSDVTFRSSEVVCSSNRLQKQLAALASPSTRNEPFFEKPNVLHG